MLGGLGFFANSVIIAVSIFLSLLLPHRAHAHCCPHPHSACYRPGPSEQVGCSLGAVTCSVCADGSRGVRPPETGGGNPPRAPYADERPIWVCGCQVGLQPSCQGGDVGAVPNPPPSDGAALLSHLPSASPVATACCMEAELYQLCKSICFLN